MSKPVLMMPCPSCRGQGHVRPAYRICPQCGGAGEVFPVSAKAGRIAFALFLLALTLFALTR